MISFVFEDVPVKVIEDVPTMADLSIALTRNWYDTNLANYITVKKKKIHQVKSLESDIQHAVMENRVGMTEELLTTAFMKEDGSIEYGFSTTKSGFNTNTLISRDGWKWNTLH